MTVIWENPFPVDLKEQSPSFGSSKLLKLEWKLITRTIYSQQGNGSLWLRLLHRSDSSRSHQLPSVCRYNLKASSCAWWTLCVHVKLPMQRNGHSADGRKFFATPVIRCRAGFTGGWMRKLWAMSLHAPRRQSSGRLETLLRNLVDPFLLVAPVTNSTSETKFRGLNTIVPLVNGKLLRRLVVR